jgi:hypothetical protein
LYTIDHTILLRKLRIYGVVENGINVAKTEFMIIGSRQRLLVHDNEHIRIEIDGKTIKRVNETKSLGLQIDEHLTWA